MNGERFQELLDGRTLASDAVRKELRQLTVDYPWFQAAHVLLAQMDHASGHVEYDVHLKRAAVHVTEREALFNLLMRPGLRKAVTAFEAAVDEQDDVAVSPHPAGEADTTTMPNDEGVAQQDGSESSEIKTIETDKAVPPHPAGQAETTIAPNEEEAIQKATALATEEEPAQADEERAADSSETAVDVETKAAEESAGDGIDEETSFDLGDHPAPPLVKASHYDDLEREILLEAISSSIEQEVAEVAEEEEEAEAEKRTEPLEIEAPKQDIAEAAPPSAESPSELVSQPAGVSGKSAYAQWLLSHRKGSSQAGVQADTKPEPKEAASGEAGRKAKERDLIETFIKNDPKISRGKAEMFSTENLAKLSVVEDESFVSETMAQIFAKQGNLKKAIKAYRTLSLKYPEKSVYFANQIKKLQELRKS